MSPYKKFKILLKQLQILLEPIYKCLTNTLSITYFNNLCQNIYLQIILIYKLVLCNGNIFTEYLNSIKNFFNNLIYTYSMYMLCGQCYLKIDDNYKPVYYNLDISVQYKIDYLMDAFNWYNKLIKTINEFVYIINQNLSQIQKSK